jgi:vacuolar-type H+-ATPase subunit I/STV1
MPRVHIQKALKDYPDIGVTKGETYYWWKRRRSPKQRSKTYPRPSQLSSARYAVVEDAIGDARDAINSAECAEDMTSALTTVADSAREVAEEYRESASNMESAFPNGCPTIDDCNEKADLLDSFAEECESVSLDDSELNETSEKLQALEQVEDSDAAALEDAESARDAALEELRQEAEAALEGLSL